MRKQGIQTTPKELRELADRLERQGQDIYEQIGDKHDCSDRIKGCHGIWKDDDGGRK